MGEVWVREQAEDEDPDICGWRHGTWRESARRQKQM